MLWKNRRQSLNVVDRRGMGGPLSVGGLIVGAIIYFLMGGNPTEYISVNTSGLQRQEATGQSNDLRQFASVVLADTEDVWNKIFKKNGFVYQEPKLVLFERQVASACGHASSAVGPFYCPSDNRLYLDLSFFLQLSDSLGAKGDFAAAYVIAHEVGHHVQTLLEIKSPSVEFELQTDCLAGLWARDTEAKSVLEEGDIEEAMNAASAVGDDRLQEASQGKVVPDSFTHGTSAQRVAAFKRGYDGQSCFSRVVEKSW